MSDFDDPDDWKEPTPSELKRQAVDGFMEGFKSEGKSGFQYRPILQAVVDRAVQKSESDDDGYANLDHYLWQAEEVIEEITSALCMWWSDPPKDKFWYGYRDDFLAEKPKEWSDDSPIDQGSLDVAAAKYLTKPWIQCNILDWYILSGLVTDELFRFAEHIRSGAVFGKMNWGYIFSGGSQIKMVLLQPVFAFIGFIVRWVLLPSVALGLLYFGYETASYWVLGTFALYVAYRLVFLPKSISIWRERKKMRVKVDKIYSELMQVRSMIGNSTLNPTQIKNRIVEAEREHALYKPAVHSILDRMIERDPAVFTRDS